MLQHGAGGCQGENSLEENYDSQKGQYQSGQEAKESPQGKSLNKCPPEHSLLDTPGISSKSAYNREFRNNLGDAFLAAELYDEYWKWLNCQKKVIPFKCLECEGEFYVPFRCDLRICPDCNKRYFMLFKARYLKALRQLLKRKKGYDRPMFLTLTTVNTGEIPSTFEVKAHNRAIGKLIRKFFKGGVSVNEVKGSYLHSHCIVYGSYIPQPKLSQEWEALTGAKVVDIREIKQKTREVINYLGKYIKKPYRVEDSEKGYSLAIQFLKSFKGVRRVHSFGIFYNLPREKKSAWACPYCESDAIYLNWKKYYEEDLTMRECQMLGILSLKEIQKAWGKTYQRCGYA